MLAFIRVAALVSLLVPAALALAWDDARLNSPLMINDQIVPYPVFSVFVMPGRPIELGFVDALGGGRVTYQGETFALGDRDLVAPSSPGLSVLNVVNDGSGETAIVNVFTLVPAGKVDRQGRLNGYRIGRYPDTPLRGLAIYRPPEGFVEVTAQNASTRVSPNFTLGQFLAKQQSDYSKYLVLRSSLLLKLENILASLNRSGRPTDRLVIMSGYRTPFYNRAIGNVAYSRHVWGGAADIYVDDTPADGVMDDMNGDGKIDRGDARWFANFINEMSQRGAFGPRIGGIGVYGSNSAHGPFVHVDVRGTRARW